jgi:hypothetical protein
MEQIDITELVEDIYTEVVDFGEYKYDETVRKQLIFKAKLLIELLEKFEKSKDFKLY